MPEFVILLVELAALITLVYLLVFGIRRWSTPSGENIAFGAGILLVLAGPLLFYDMTVGSFYRELNSRRIPEEQLEEMAREFTLYVEQQPADATQPVNVPVEPVTIDMSELMSKMRAETYGKLTALCVTLIFGFLLLLLVLWKPRPKRSLPI